MIKAFPPLLILLGIIRSIAAQPSLIHQLDGRTLTAQKIDQMAQQLMDSAQVTGLCIAVLNNHQVVYTKAYGYANLENKVSLNHQSLMCGASFSKAVFAYLCMRMVDKGRLELDKPIASYLAKPLPEFPRYQDLSNDSRWTQITARMCLNHTTGFPNWRFLHPYTADYVPQGKLAIYFTPGKKYAYSGEGIDLLQLVLEQITGRTLQDLAEEEVFKPLSMTRTSYVWKSAFESNYADGHAVSQQVIPNRKRSKPDAAGSLQTTVEDMAIFLTHLAHNGGLSPQSYQDMFSPQVRIHSLRQFPTLDSTTTTDHEDIQLAYGLGWGLLHSPYGPAFFKEGHDDGWQHYMIQFRTAGTGLIIMTNSDNGEKIFKDLLASIIGDTFTPWDWQRYWPYYHEIYRSSKP